MAKILACSANGYGTGLMMKMTLDKVIEICGFKVEEDAFNSIMEGRKIAAICGFKVEEDAFNSIMEGRKIAAQYDIVLCPINYVDMFEDAAAKGTVVLGLNNVMAQGEMTEALKNCGIDLK